MACYGGDCKPSCPMFDMHHPRLIECGWCGKTALSWYVQDGRCPACGERVEGELGHDGENSPLTFSS